MYAGTVGIFFCFYPQLNRLLLNDNINPINRFYIVLFVLPEIRSPPQAFSNPNEDKENAYVYE